MSLHYPLTPVHRLCDECKGLGRIADDLCKPCDGIGRVFIEGGPSFGCKKTLADAKVGQMVRIGNGDRGRVLRHCKRHPPTTHVILIDPMFEIEDENPTEYPSVTGMIVVGQATRLYGTNNDGHRSREDHLDPLQKRTTAL